MKDLFDHTETPTVNDIDLLKVGRYHRLDEETTMVVGRNKAENEAIRMLVLPGDILLEARDFVGPTTILRGKTAENHVKFAASVTLKYSDAPDAEGRIIVSGGGADGDIVVAPATEQDYKKFRV